jgi:phenylalanyl-tRNA synthetase beta chain
MKISLNWVREFVEVPGDAAAVAELLTRAGVEVEGIETRGADFPKVVVAQISESTQHPNADRLSVCMVDDGSGQPRQIVCGAKNYNVGDKVPLALPGAVLPGDFKIKSGKLRGVVSDGMLCSAKELQLAEDAAGLLILPAEAPVGAPISALFPADTILDVEITPNRADLLSHRGIAREIAALSGVPWKESPRPEARVPAVEQFVRVENRELCPYYTARKINGVTVGPSPDWLKAKLEAAGIRPINNVVDITNFVMLEVGQPLHAFDAAVVERGVVVRTARQGETLHALDGKTYTLDSGNLLIADEVKPIGLAGVMGGEQSGVTASTTAIILESAYFAPSNIRRTARSLGIQSDAAYRFERGVDPGGVEAASDRAVALIEQLASGRPEPVLWRAGEPPVQNVEIPLRIERAEQVLGIQITAEEAGSILSRFGIEKSGDGWRPPTYRGDLQREIDLIEELIRVVGIDNVAATERARFSPATDTDRVYDFQMRLRRTLASLGFSEARTLSLICAAEAGDAEALQLRNPMNEQEAVLRPTLLPLLQAAAGRNARRGEKNLRLFEIGRVFAREGESTNLAILWTGHAQAPNWRSRDVGDVDLFSMKGLIEALGIGDVSWVAVDAGRGLEIHVGGTRVGTLTEVARSTSRKLDIATPVIVAEIRLDPAWAAPRRIAVRELPKFPAISRDMALVVDESTPHGRVIETILSAGESLLVGAELFDVFTDPAGEKVPPGKKSLAYSLTYRAADRTLLLNEANEAHDRIKERLAAQLGVQFRE